MASISAFQAYSEANIIPEKKSKSQSKESKKPKRQVEQSTNNLQTKKRAIPTFKASLKKVNGLTKKQKILTKKRKVQRDKIEKKSKNSGQVKKRAEKTKLDVKINRKSVQSTSNVVQNGIDQLNEEVDDEVIMENSIDKGKELFSWIISPRTLNEFMHLNWEKRPQLIKRNYHNYYQHILSTNTFFQMLSDNHVEYTKNLDVTSYENGVRQTHNPEGRALPAVVRQFYNDGCSLRLLNPQTFLRKIYEMNATLQEYFQCMTGANIYLTPPNSQGFAPHFDDIEAFVLQIEGKKHWRLYNPRIPEENLARYSSPNFDQSQIGDPILDCILEPGDLLYFPRGIIHQANTVPDNHSLHITLSVYQKQSFGDLLEILLPMALQEAISRDVKLRSGLPLNIWQTLGTAYSDQKSNERVSMENQVKKLFMNVFQYLAIDEAVDRMAIRYQHDALPPILSKKEKARTVYGSAHIDDPDVIQPDTKVRLIKANIIRLVRYDDELRVYFYNDNSKEYHQFEENYIQILDDDAPAIKLLIRTYPKYIKVNDLQLNDIDRNISVAQDLWERGILMTKLPI